MPSLAIRLFISKLTFTQLSSVAFTLIVFVSMGEYTIYAHKMLSFSPRAYSYPPQMLLDKLQHFSQPQHDRIMGFWDSEISTNLHTSFKLLSAEGYNPLHSNTYQQLVASAETGEYSLDSLKRSDADFPSSHDITRNRLLDLTSIKYIAARVTDPEEYWEVEPLKYNPNRFQLIWQAGGFKIYQNIHALPRVKLFQDYQVLPDLKERIATLYSSEFNPHHFLILDQDPLSIISNQATGSAKITSYTPNQVVVDTDTQGGDLLLLLTDSYYPSWKAFLNKQPTKIYRANHTFRAVIVPEGRNQIVFKNTWP